jgi:NADPH:quinone reductase-like Zn-dependent oxidoreductase
MKAAVLHTFGNPPHYEDFPDPQPSADEVIVHVKAASLRSSGIEIYGSGSGSIPHTAIFDAFPKVWALVNSGKLRIDTDRQCGKRLATERSIWPQACHYRVAN